MAEHMTRQTNPDRFEISVEGKRAAFVHFADHDGRRIFFRTETAPEFDGQGLADAVVKHALEITRQEGLRIVSVCPYVRTWLATHEGYGDAVDAATPDMLAAIPRR